MCVCTSILPIFCCRYFCFFFITNDVRFSETDRSLRALKQANTSFQYEGHLTLWSTIAAQGTMQFPWHFNLRNDCYSNCHTISMSLDCNEIMMIISSGNSFFAAWHHFGFLGLWENRESGILSPLSISDSIGVSGNNLISTIMIVLRLLANGVLRGRMGGWMGDRGRSPALAASDIDLSALLFLNFKLLKYCHVTTHTPTVGSRFFFKCARAHFISVLNFHYNLSKCACF